MPIQQGYPSGKDAGKPRYFVLKHEMLDVPKFYARWSVTGYRGWCAQCALDSNGGFAPIFGSTCTEGNVFYCVWEAMPGYGAKEIENWLYELIDRDIMKNTATEISTENSWFPGEPPFLLPRYPLDPVEPQKTNGTFLMVRMETEDPAGRAAKIGQFMKDGLDAGVMKAIQAGVLCHFCLHEPDNKIAYGLFEIDAARGITDTFVKEFIATNLMPAGCIIDVFRYGPGLTGVPAAVFAKNGENLAYADRYTLFTLFGGESPDSCKTFLNSPFVELLERKATDLGGTRYYFSKVKDQDQYMACLEGSKSYIDKLADLSEKAGWLLNDPTKPLKGPLEVKKLQLMQHTRWARTQEECVDFVVGMHGVEDFDAWLEMYNGPMACWTHKTAGVAESFVLKDVEGDMIYAFHTILPGMLEKARATFSVDKIEEIIAQVTAMGAPNVIKRPIMFQWGDLLTRKTLNLRHSPAPLQQYFNVFTECTVSDVDAVVKHIEASKFMYLMSGFEETIVLKDCNDPKKCLIVGTFSDCGLVDQFKADKEGKSMLKQMFTPPGAEISDATPCTTYVCKAVAKYGWVNNKRQVGESICYFKHATESMGKCLAFRASEKYQLKMQGYGLTTVIPSTQLAVQGSSTSKNREDAHVLCCFGEKEKAAALNDLAAEAVEDIEKVPFLKAAQDAGIVVHPFSMSHKEVVGII